MHGGRSPQIVSAFNTIITSASHALCTGTPTASFAAIFSSISEVNGEAQGTQTGVSDQFPGQTAVSLYYTVSGSQGPGAITRSATAATATGGASMMTTQSGSETSGSAVTSRTSSKASAATGNSSASGSFSTSSSSAGAAATGFWMGALGVIAGGAVLAAL